MIPIVKTSESNLINITSNQIQIEEKYFNYVHNKAVIWNKSDKYKSFALFCDDNNVIAIEFDENGKSIKKSSLLIDEELEILENCSNLSNKKIGFKILSKSKIQLKTRKQLNEENFIKQELKNIDTKKLEYIYFECFGKQEKNKKIIIEKLLKLSKNSKTYKNLYNILKLTSTTNK